MVYLVKIEWNFFISSGSQGCNGKVVGDTVRSKWHVHLVQSLRSDHRPVSARQPSSPYHWLLSVAELGSVLPGVLHTKPEEHPAGTHPVVRWCHHVHHGSFRRVTHIQPLVLDHKQVHLICKCHRCRALVGSGLRAVSFWCRTTSWLRSEFCDCSWSFVIAAFPLYLHTHHK